MGYLNSQCLHIYFGSIYPLTHTDLQIMHPIISYTINIQYSALIDALNFKILHYKIYNTKHKPTVLSYSLTSK